MPFRIEHVPPSLRTLLRNKRFATMAVLCLSFAIALNTTMYSVIDALMHPTVEFHEPDRLYRLAFFGDFRRKVSPADRKDAVMTATQFEGLARSAAATGVTIAERGGRVREVTALNVSSNYFAVVGARPLAGRLISVADEGVEPQPVVLAERVWGQFFPERETFDTATILINGEPRLVVGVLDKRAEFPNSRTDVWQLPAANDEAFATGLRNLVRLKEGVPLSAAYTELQHIAVRIATMAGEDANSARFRLTPAVRQGFQFLNFHYAMIGAVLAVLLVACFNLANLQLARGISRTREFATRAAVGASRRDLINLILAETGWLAFAGIALGLILTAWGMQIVTSSMPPQVSRYFVEPQASWRLVVVAAAAGVLSLIIVGVLPAIKLSRVDVNEVLKRGAGTGATKRSRVQYGLLVVMQVAFALPLLVGAALLTRAAISLYAVDINPIADRLTIGSANIRTAGPTDRRRLADISGVLLSRLRSIEGVEEAATEWPRSPAHDFLTVYDGAGQPREIATGRYSYSIVSAGFLRALGMPIISGRPFTEGEFKEPLAIVDQHTADYLWPGKDPVGQMLNLGSMSKRDVNWVKVVGVAAFVNKWGGFTRANLDDLKAPGLGAIYVLDAADTARVLAYAADPRRRGLRTSISIAVRGRTPDPRMPLLVRNALADASAGVTAEAANWGLTSGLQVTRVRQNFMANLFNSFALLALVLASLGVYAIVSHSVSQRTREIGVRVALGATAQDIRRSVLFEGNVLALAGIAIGLMIIAPVAGLLRAFLQDDAARYDSWIYGLMALLMFGATLLASWFPARRAMRINPVEALRND
jgi:putative ABC transport system permease protein